jgi:hypothetical protein
VWHLASWVAVTWISIFVAAAAILISTAVEAVRVQRAT